MNEDYHSLGVEAMNYIRGLRSRLNKVRKDLYYGSSSQTCADTLQLINETMVDELIENIDFFHGELMLHVEGDE